MTAQPLPTFEALRAALVELPVPPGAQDRATHWVYRRMLGLAKTSSRRIEIFLGGAVSPQLPLVRRHIAQGQWRSPEDGASFLATRLVLPDGAHYEPVACMVAVEILRAGLQPDGENLASAFANVEPLIEMALRGLASGDEQVVGLLGELLVLEQLFVVSNDVSPATVLGSWRGYERGSRDFMIHNAAIEVKSTTNHTSRHRISSLHQIEPQLTTNGVKEKLWLLSVGLGKVTGGSLSVASVVDRILELLGPLPPGPAASTPLQEVFLQNLARYGIGFGSSYDHFAMKTWPAFQQSFEVTFSPRLYDICDEEIRLVRYNSLKDSHVDPAEMEYTFSLPDTVNDRNPVRGWQRVLIDQFK